MPKSIIILCNDLRHLYEDTLLTTIELSTLYGCSVTTITKRLHACGVTLRSARFQERAVPEAELRRLYVVERLTVTAIARHFGVAVSTIYNRCRSYGLPLRRAKSRSRSR